MRDARSGYSKDALLKRDAWSGYSEDALLKIKKNYEDAIARYQGYIDAISAVLASRDVKPGDRVRVTHNKTLCCTGVLLDPQDNWISLIKNPHSDVTNWVLRDDGKGHLFGVSSNLHRLEKIK